MTCSCKPLNWLKPKYFLVPCVCQFRLNSFFSNGILYKFATHKDTTFFYTYKFYTYFCFDNKRKYFGYCKKNILSESESIAKLADFIDDELC
jgi:GTPase SAR1 family protein